MTEKWKCRLLFLLVFVTGMAGMTTLVLWRQAQYQTAAFSHISKYCEILLEDCPRAETQVLSALKEYSSCTWEEIEESSFLNQYGYWAQEADTGADKGMWILFFLFATLFAGALFVLGQYLTRRKNRRIAGLTEYLEEVNTGSGGGALQGAEDDFSKLQDEMYKTVTMLYQTREAAVEAKKNFADNLANIAHQLKTPITSVSLSLQLMEQQVHDPHIGQIQRQLERLIRLEESLLTLSQIDAGTLTLALEEVDVYTALELAAENLGAFLRERGVSVKIPEKESAVFCGDLEWTMEALMNIMKNCAEHSPYGGEIRCDYSSNPLYAEIRIEDEGEGFAPEDIPHLFERFYRGRKAKNGGIGIGLPLARSIFELQNGTIRARNLQGGGACFEIRLYSH